VSRPNPAATTPDGPRYIVITECLQNDFFLNPECRLYLGDSEVKKLLIAKRSHDFTFDVRQGRRGVPDRLLREGPLGRFLEAVIGKRLQAENGELLHVVNIRDWHVPDRSYDSERRLYGRHCEAGTWGAGYIAGLRKYLDPEPPLADGRARFCARGNARIYHVHADSVFDFRPRWEERKSADRIKFNPSVLERLLDVLIGGSDEHLALLSNELRQADETGRRQSQDLNRLLSSVMANPMWSSNRVYVLVIGVYTDVKIQLILTGLRTRYELPNLAVSDSLTGSKTLERHLSGLDFADKLLNVEVIHGIGDLASFLGSEPPLADESDTVGALNFSHYSSYFSDKQNVLAYQSEKLQEYVQLTANRSIRVYETINRANRFLLLWGGVFLTLTLVGNIVNLISPGRWSWEASAVTGGLGLLQIVSAFFGKPIRELQQNLHNLASFKMILEGHSLKTAFTRYHLTTPEVLRELGEPTDVDSALGQIKALEAQLGVIDQFQTSDYEALGRVVGLPVAETDGAMPPPHDGQAAARQPDAKAPASAAKQPART
jgi:hypothetical protein